MVSDHSRKPSATMSRKYGGADCDAMPRTAGAYSGQGGA